MKPPLWNVLLAAVLGSALAACGGNQDANGTPAAGERTTADGSKDADAPNTKPSVRTATLADDPCSWIPVSEVETVVGKLAGPPKREDGCRYTLAIPEEVSAKRQQQIDQQERLQEKLKAAFKDYKPPEWGGPLANFQRDPANYALTLSVDVSGDMAGEIGMAAGLKHLESWLPPQQRGAEARDADTPAAPDGWDAHGLAPYGFSGRIGHVRITVLGQAPDVPRDLAKALAERVRDRIPDLPFPADNPYQVMRLGREPRPPCSLLTRAEAEAVLGPLTVDPYRASSQHPALAHEGGHGCAYFTARHHVFTIVPKWRDGGEDFKIEKGIGGLMSSVLPQDPVVMKGSWDQAHVSAGTGALLFLKGDQMLEVHYKTSSTDMRGAVKLAATAMKRMAS